MKVRGCCNCGTVVVVEVASYYDNESSMRIKLSYILVLLVLYYFLKKIN